MIGRLLRGVAAGERKTMWHDPAAADVPETIEVSSPAFQNGGLLPRSATGRGGGQSPELAWTGVPTGARCLALVVEDPDVPLPRPFVHALALLRPSATRLAAAALDGDGDTIVARGRNSFLRRGWAPPTPPPGHGPHRYAFQLFALSANPSSGVAGRGAVRRLLAGSVLAKGRIIGIDEQ